MDLGSIFLILALLVLVGLYIGRPFFDHKGINVSREEREHSSLLAERDRILAALQELDFDNSMGKIPEEDYPIQRAMLLKKGADILRLMEAQHDQKEANKEQAILKAVVTSGDGVIPVPVAAGTNGNELPDDDLEVLIASRRRARLEKTGGFCPQCGGPLQRSDMFCPKCGAGVKN
jgi:predicted protein tyrosine phosphatase